MLLGRLQLLLCLGELSLNGPVQELLISESVLQLVCLHAVVVPLALQQRAQLITSGPHIFQLHLSSLEKY